MQEKLRLNCAPVQLPIGLEDEHSGLIDLVKMKAFTFEGPNGETIKEVRSTAAYSPLSPSVSAQPTLCLHAQLLYRQPGLPNFHHILKPVERKPNSPA